MMFACFCCLFFREDQNGEQRLSVGGMHSPVSLQPSSGDPYCEEGNSLKVIALNLVPGCKCFSLFVG